MLFRQSRRGWQNTGRAAAENFFAAGDQKTFRLKFGGFIFMMFSVAAVRQALGVPVAVSAGMEQSIRRWNRLLASPDPADALRLPAAVSGELARLCTLEADIRITGSPRADFLSAALDPVRHSLRRCVQLGAAAGGLVWKPCVLGRTLRVEAVRAGDFWPVAFDGTRLTAAVFCSRKVQADRVFTRFEYHHLEPDGCHIENRAFVSGRFAPLGLASADIDGTPGTPCSLTRVPEWAALQPAAVIRNVDRLLMGWFRMPGANCAEPLSPLGASCFADAEPLIREANRQWQRILWEYEGTELAVHADATLFARTRSGEPILPEGHNRLYRLLPGLENRIDTFAPAIRDAPLWTGLDNMLRRIEFNCALAYGTLSDPRGVDRTAEEIKASKKRSFDAVREMQTSLQAALDGLLYAMDTWATLGGLAPAGTWHAAYDWDDSIANDPSQRKELFWQYVQAGKFPMARFLVEFEGYTPAEAAGITAECAGHSAAQKRS
jgi:A118 family predicted phage portal protein